MNDSAPKGLGQCRRPVVHIELQEDALDVRAGGIAADPDRAQRMSVEGAATIAWSRGPSAETSIQCGQVSRSRRRQ